MPSTPGRPVRMGMSQPGVLLSLLLVLLPQTWGAGKRPPGPTWSGSERGQEEETRSGEETIKRLFCDVRAFLEISLCVTNYS